MGGFLIRGYINAIKNTTLIFDNIYILIYSVSMSKENELIALETKYYNTILEVLENEKIRIFSEWDECEEIWVYTLFTDSDKEAKIISPKYGTNEKLFKKAINKIELIVGKQEYQHAKTELTKNIEAVKALL